MLIASRVITLPYDGSLVAALIEMAVDAVVTGVQYSVFVPADMQVVALERYVFDFANSIQSSRLAVSAQKASLFSTDSA